MSFSRHIQWYHSHVDPIWLDGTFNSMGLCQFNGKLHRKSSFLLQERLSFKDFSGLYLDELLGVAEVGADVVYEPLPLLLPQHLPPEHPRL
jgi:hypothetical protein